MAPVDPMDRRTFLGTALMGSGNFTYRDELLGKKGSFMTFASFGISSQT